jgi:biopolymer transport protein ExbD
LAVDRLQLLEKLSAIAKQFQNQPVRIRGDGNVAYQRIVEVIDTCQKAGIWNISFATQRPEPTK